MKERLKEIWKETIKKHIRRWKALPGVASVTSLLHATENQEYIII